LNPGGEIFSAPVQAGPGVPTQPPAHSTGLLGLLPWSKVAEAWY